MKSLRILLVSMVIGSFAMAEDAVVNISDVMAKMENGLVQIQKGFLYNNVEWIKNGINEVQKENLVYHERKNILSMLPKNKKQMENAAILTSHRIDNAAKEMKEYLQHKQMRNAFNAYSSMLNACTDCHTIVRGW